MNLLGSKSCIVLCKTVNLHCGVRKISLNSISSSISDRAFIEVWGKDTFKFLHGLCTNDVEKLHVEKTVFPATFLTAKGRIFASTLMYTNTRPDLNASILIETHKANSKALLTYLTNYKLRSKVKIDNVTDLSVSHIEVTEDLSLDALKANDSSVLFAVKDPRSSDLGARIITRNSQEVETVNEVALSRRQDWQQVHNILSGVVDGPEISNRIPLECNLDLLNHISFKKGCYVGQELTARTKYKGLVRKRLVPFLLAPSASVSATNSSGSFDVLSEERRSELLSATLSGEYQGSISQQHIDTTQLLVGAKLFKIPVGDNNTRDDSNSSGSVGSEPTITKAKKMTSVGEIVCTDRAHKIGLALINLEVAFGTVGNLAAINLPRQEEESEEGQGELSSQLETGSKQVSAESMLAEGKVNYISAFRPSWFDQLDLTTGKMKDV